MRNFGYKNMDIGGLYIGVAPPNYPMQGLIHYYNMNELSGNTFSDKIGNNTLTRYNGGVIGVNAKIGTGYQITAKNQSAGLLNVINTPDLTASMWYYFDGTINSWNTLFCRNGGGFHHILIQNTTYIIGMWNGSFRSTGYALIPKNWYNIAFTQKGTLHKIYVNGAQVGTDLTSFNNVTNPLQIIGGHSTATSQGSIGIIDEVSIWDRELTSEEISLIYNGGNGISI